MKALFDTLPPLPDLFGNPVLRDFHEVVPGPAIDWAPQTPGWYLLTAIFAALTLRMAFRYYRRWLRNRYRREALRELAVLHRGGEIDPAAINALLKRTAMVASSRPEVAALTGADWCRWLAAQIDHKPLNDQVLACFGDALYGSGATADIALNDLFAEARHWLQHHRDDHAPA